MAVQLSARNATAEDLVALLQQQQAEKLDLVVPAANIYSRGGLIVVKEAEPQLTDEGVTLVNGTYRPTEIFDEGLSAKLDVPLRYVRRLREQRPDILDANVNGLLHGRKIVQGTDGGGPRVLYPADDRTFLLRLFRGNGGEGVARAMASDRFNVTMDNLDMLIAVTKGIQAAGVDVITRVSDLSERGMRVRFEAPDINMLAPGLLGDYKSPFDGPGGFKRAGAFDEMRQRYGAHHIFEQSEAPLAYMGIDFRNSETGQGKYTLNPVVGYVKCTNGWIDEAEGLARVHLGTRLEVGQVKPSADTLRKAGELVAAETRDAVVKWLSPGFLEYEIRKFTEKSQVELPAPSTTVPAIVKGLGFTEDEAKGVLDMFIRSSQPTAGGLAQAVSAFAQTVEDPDRAYAIELQTLPALEKASAR